MVRSLLATLKASVLFGTLLFVSMIAIVFADSVDLTTAVIKSPADHREYQVITLKNGLQVMLVSDHQADEAAAAMDVYVGSGDDPDDREGLAHYLEHMLFLGTQKYPEAGEYQKFIRQHGGQNNAYTVLTNTNYYFSIDPAFLEPALDRFAQFFTAPLFNQKYVQRERSVVDSEYKARVKDEGRRLWTARTQAYNPAHPATGFSVGSLENLADRKGDRVREDLIAFYKQHYHAGKMRLVVVGKESLGQLEVWVREKFSAVPKAQAARQSYAAPLFLPNSLPKQIIMKPLKETRRVTFSFPVESSWPYRDSRPLAYLSNLIGHEGEGSLLAELQKRAWASGLSAGRGYMDEIQGIFDISIQLSPQGLKHIDEIGSMLFAQLALIKEQGLKEVYFQEQKQLAELDFKFLEQSTPQQLAQSVASQMQRIAPTQVLISPYSFKRYDETAISQFLSAMRPDNLLLSIVDPNLSSSQLTPWYDVEYAITPIDEKRLHAWQNTEQQQWATLPSINPFIPQETTLLPAQLADAKLSLLHTEGKLQVWHQTLLDYHQPKAEFYFSVQSPAANVSPSAAMLTQLYVNAVNEALSAYTYPAYLAGLEYNMYPHSRGFSVRISGYSDKQPVLLQRLLDVFELDQLSEQKFQQLKQRLRQELENINKGRPSDVLIGGVYDVILSSSWSTEEKLGALESIELDALQQHAEDLFMDVQVKALSMGNVTKEQSIQLANRIERKLGDAIGNVELSRATVRTLQDGESIFIEKPLSHPDSATILYFQGSSKTIKQQAITQLLSAAMGPGFYQNLRTENEVGYLVQAFAFNLLEVPGMALSIQSSSHSAKAVLDLIDQFFQQYDAELASLTEAELQTIKAGVVSQLSQRDKTLKAAASRAWREIDRKEFSFNTRDQLIKAINDVSKQDLIEFFKERVLSPKRAELLLVHYGDKQTELTQREVDTVVSGSSLPALRKHLNHSFPSD